MKKGLIALSLVCALALTGLAFAHGAGNHVRGTVIKVDATHVEVKTRDGKTVSVALTKDTKYSKKEAAATSADLLEGVRVVIDVAKKGEALEATQVQIGLVREKPAAPPAAPPKQP